MTSNRGFAIGSLLVCTWLLVPACGTTDDSGGPGTDAGYQSDRNGSGDTRADSPSADEVESILARISACLESGDRIGIGMMYALFDAYQALADTSQSTEVKLTGALLDCYIQASTCDEVQACGHATEAQGQVCSGTDTDPHCVGDVLVECTDDPEERHEAYDCAAAGLVCGEGEYDAECGERTCTPGTDASYCQGDVLWECDSGAGVFTAEDCRYYISYHCTSQGEGEWVCVMNGGGTCGEDPDFEGDYECIGTGAECDPSTFENRCEGTTLVSCRNNREARFDCRNMGSTGACGEGESGSMECVEARGECSLSTPESCSGGVITYCAAGQIEQLDCRSYGYGGCATGVAILGIAAYCVP